MKLILTNSGPKSHLWATGAITNHNMIPAQAFRLSEKIAITRISVTSSKEKLKGVFKFQIPNSVKP